MKGRKRSYRDTMARKEWLKKAGQWDGQAVVYNQMERKTVPADWYKDHVAEYVMWDFDRRPASQRTRMANSLDGEGTEKATVIRR